jgi:ABC-type transport system substrate-binding protein/basic membrane lipoprotein Med (substrate-binding protein (PBP1-ABC) superfamily)
MVTDVGGIDDKSFNATSWAGMEMVEQELGVEVAYLESQQQTDYAANITQFLDQDYDFIVTVGFLLGDDTATFAEQNPDTNFAIVDFAYDPVIPNVLGLTFATDEAAFLAGYAAAGMSQTGKVGTFGGIEIPPVTIFMDGYAAGVGYYNQQHGTSVEVLGTDLFVGNFESTDDGRRAGEDLIAEGADIIMPVAGPVGLGTAAAIQENPGTMLIGVDTDWCVSAAEYCDVTLTSVLKNMDVAVYTAIEQALEGTFEGGFYVGTLDNDGVGIAPFHEFEDDVPADLKAELEEVRQGVIAGTIHTGWGVAEAPPPAAAGGTFIFGRGGDTIRTDPAVVTDGESFRVTGQLMDALFQYEDGGTRPIPALATDYEVSDDAKVWTVNLREGVKFHDGTDFNADAVVFNFERQWKTDHEYHYESLDYEYWGYMWGGFDDESIIASVVAVDDLTVEFTLKEPLAPMLANLAMDMFAISSPTKLKECGENYGTPTCGGVGTGPFKFVEWVEDDHITVEANEDYWGGRPKVDQVIWRVIPDDSARYLALQAGDIHGMMQAVIEDVRSCEDDPDCYVEAAGLNTGYLAFNYHIKELQDPKVREAIMHAIDREALREAFYGNYGQVASTFLHPSMWGRPDIEDWTYDPELSKQLLAEAGFPDGLKEVTNEDTGEVGPLKLYYMPVTRFYYPSPKEIGEAMAADLARAGIVTELYLEGDWPTYLAAGRAGELYGLYMLGWGGDNGDPDNFLCYFFCRVGDPDDIDGAGWYYNPELAELLKAAAVATDQDARAPMYEEAERMLHEDRARLWVMHNDTPNLYLTKVKGVTLQPVGANKLEQVYLEE